MSKFTKVLIIFFIIILALFLGVAFSINKLKSNVVSNTTSSFKYSESSKYTIVDGKIDVNAEKIKKLDISWLFGEVRIEEYDGPTIRFKEEYDGDIDDALKTRYYIDKNELKIAFAASGKKNDGNTKKSLVVYIPSQSVLNNIEINNVSSSVLIKLSSFDSIEIDTVSGECRVDVDYLADLEFDSVSGDLYLTAKKEVEEIDFSSVSSSVYISIPSSSSFKAKIDGVSTSMDSTFKGTLQGKNFVVGSGKNDYSFSSVSGRIVINEL